MKHLMHTFLIVVFISMFTSLTAQVPGIFNYQAILRDATGQGIDDEHLDLQFQIYDQPEDGSVVFVEEFLNVPTGQHGVINLKVGLNGSKELSELSWVSTAYFINVQVRPAGSGAAYVNISETRTQLVSVPMAIFSTASSSSDYSALAGKADTALYAASVKILTDNTLKGTGAGIDSLGIARMGAQQGQVLQWNNGRWRPGTVMSGGGSVVTDDFTLEGTGLAVDPLSIKQHGVSNNELADDAVTSDKIENGGVEAEDLSDMNASVGEALIYGPDGWKPEVISSSGSHWTKVGDNLFVNNGEFVGINTDSPDHPGLTILDGELSVRTPFGVVSSNSHLVPGTLSLSVANSIVSNSTTILGPDILTIESGGFAGGGPYGMATVTPLLMKIQSYEALSAVENSLHQDGTGSGFSTVYGENGSRNVRITNLLGAPNNGFVAVYDENESLLAGVIVNSLNQGEVFADVKNFRISNPRDPSTDIWYACIEGPEAAAYERGTATLVSGEVFVPFSDHFQSVVNPETMTVILTPHSTDTYGLAAIEKRANGFRVKELKGGTGGFTFDWEVKGVRKGYENYQVIRDKNYSKPE